MNPPGAPGHPHVTVVGDVGLDVLAKLDGEVVRGEETSARVTASPGGAGGTPPPGWRARASTSP